MSYNNAPLYSPGFVPPNSQNLYGSHADSGGDVNEIWSEHDAGNGRFYYFNKETQQSSWIKPVGFISEKDKLIPVSKKQALGTPWEVVYTLGGYSYYYNVITKETTWEKPDVVDLSRLEDTEKDQEKDDNTNESKKRKMDEPLDDSERTLKKARLDVPPNEEGDISHLKKLYEEQQSESGDSSSEEESYTLQEKIDMFIEFLDEQNIDQFATWNKVAPKLIYDERFKILETQEERKRAFDKYMGSRLTKKPEVVPEEKIETGRASKEVFRGANKKDSEKKASSDFNEMLEEMKDKITHATTFNDLKEMCANDPRFDALESRVEKDLLFYNFVRPLKEDHKKKVEEAKEKFLDLIEEIKDLRHDSRWSKVKKTIYKDPRYGIDVLTSSEREKFFYEYIDILKKEYEEEQKKLSKKRRVEEYQRKRRAEVEEMKRKSFQIMGKQKRTADVELEKINFKVMVTEYVYQSDLTYEEFCRSMEEKDEPRFFTRYMRESEKEDIFYDRIKELAGSKEKDFEKLLFNTHRVDIDSEWHEIEELIWDEPEYFEINPDSYKKELFNRYVRELRREAEQEFWEMLRDFPTITARTDRKSPDYPIIENLLRGDNRWARLDCLPGRRMELYDEFIHRLRTDPKSVRGNRRDEFGRDRNSTNIRRDKKIK
eukprot:TRINITY_DN10571_c0_g1_i1.p1 TRINITY_DN10571_c0_g1~~TRINITY_DN10571_c0_g1_i1.p1  ORF type:complete len:657 (-),score=198.79 TRINITY_DN10571_c0_g1_i1:2-1972(-)